MTLDRQPKQPHSSDLAHRQTKNSEYSVLRLGIHGPAEVSVLVLSIQAICLASWCLPVLPPACPSNTLTACRSTTHHRDLKCVLGGSKTLLTTTFLHMLQTIYDTYKLRLSDITFFEPVKNTTTWTSLIIKSLDLSTVTYR